MSAFDTQTVEDEVAMLGGMIEEIDTSIATAHETKQKLVSIRAALASAIGVELPSVDESQLHLTLVGEGEGIEITVDK